MPEIKRKFFYYDVQFNVLNRTTNTVIAATNQRNMANNVFNHINTLPYDRVNLDRSRYFDVGGGNRSFVVIENQDATCIKGKIIISRYNLLPDIEIGGNLVPIYNRIPAEAGLAEVTHFILYLQHNLIGIEYNYFGARISSLCNYIMYKASHLTHHVDYNPRLNQDIDNKLNNMGEVSLIDIELKRNSINLATQIDENLGNAFQASAAISDSETVQVILKKKKRAKRGFEFPFNVQRISEVLGFGNNREEIDRFRIRAVDLTDNTVKPIDLLEDQFIITRNVIKIDDTTKRLDSDSVYRAIEDGYQSVINELIIQR